MIDWKKIKSRKTVIASINAILILNSRFSVMDVVDDICSSFVLVRHKKTIGKLKTYVSNTLTCMGESNILENERVEGGRWRWWKPVNPGETITLEMMGVAYRRAHAAKKDVSPVRKKKTPSTQDQRAEDFIDKVFEDKAITDVVIQMIRMIFEEALNEIESDAQKQVKNRLDQLSAEFDKLKEKFTSV